MWFRKDTRPANTDKSKTKRKKADATKPDKNGIKKENAVQHEDAKEVKSSVEVSRDSTDSIEDRKELIEAVNIDVINTNGETKTEKAGTDQEQAKEECKNEETVDSVIGNHVDEKNHDASQEEEAVNGGALEDVQSEDQGEKSLQEDVKEEEQTAQEHDKKEEKEVKEPVIPEIVIEDTACIERYTEDAFLQKELQSIAVVVSDSECGPEKKKPKHRKTMSMSSTLELVKCLGDELIETAKREIEEHSRKKDYCKKKEKDQKHTHDKDKTDCDKRKSDKGENNDMVTLILYDASFGETDGFEVVEESDFNPKKSHKKKDSKDSGKSRKSSAVSMMNAQKNTVKKLAKASSVSALNFIRSKKKPFPLMLSIDTSYNSLDHIILSTELLLEHERVHTGIVQDPEILHYPKKEDKNDKHAKSSSGDEDDEEIYYDAKSLHEEVVENNIVKMEQPKLNKSVKNKKTLGSSLKRTNGGRRRGRKRSTTDEPPPLPPRMATAAAPLAIRPSLVRQPNLPHKHSHWLFGNSFKGDSKRDEDAGLDTLSQMTDHSHTASEHSAERSDSTSHSRSGSGIGARPVTRAESYRDRVDRVKRTKRKTSDPNQLTSNKDFPDVEVLGASGGPVAPSGASSNSSLSSKSNESTHAENEDSQSEWSEEEDNSTPWSAKAPPELLSSMSGVARKRQDLIHELILSECSHVRWLRVLKRVYLRPLQKAGTTLLTPHELRALLPNLPEVLHHHRRLSCELKVLLMSRPKVSTAPLADALITMLGESRYAPALAKFCRGQALAQEALRERRKRNKELNAFLQRSEQDPLCARLRLQALLACVWQRLTKYQLLLEGIMKTASATDDEVAVGTGPDGSVEPGQGEDFGKVAYALELARDVLNNVNTAIQTCENEHRLRNIQSKLEVRVGEAGDVTGELKKLDLARHNLVMEGTLSIRHDSSKRVSVLALLLKECLVLLHTDGERYILKPIPQATHLPLSPIIHWNTVFIRSNAAVKNGFFIVNLNGLQMYDMSAGSNTEYNTWTKHLNEAATALESRSCFIEEPTPMPPPPPTATPSDSIPNGTPEPDIPIDEEREEPKAPENEDDGNQVNGAEVSVVSEEEAGISGARNKLDTSLLEPDILTITQPPVTLLATVEITPEERLRRAEEKMSIALEEVAEASREIVQSKPMLRRALSTLTVGIGTAKEAVPVTSTQQLLLQGQDHVNKLTDVLLRALRVTSPDCSMTKCSLYTSDGLCDSCSAKFSKFSGSNRSISTERKTKVKSICSTEEKGDSAAAAAERTTEDEAKKDDGSGARSEEEAMDSIVILEDVGESSTDPNTEWDLSLVESSGAGLRSILTELLIRLPQLETERDILRAQLQNTNDRVLALHLLHKDCNHVMEPAKSEAVDESTTPSSTDPNGGAG